MYIHIMYHHHKPPPAQHPTTTNELKSPPPAPPTRASTTTAPHHHQQTTTSTTNQPKSHYHGPPTTTKATTWHATLWHPTSASSLVNFHHDRINDALQLLLLCFEFILFRKLVLVKPVQAVLDRRFDLFFITTLEPALKLITFKPRLTETRPAHHARLAIDPAIVHFLAKSNGCTEADHIG